MTDYPKLTLDIVGKYDCDKSYDYFIKEDVYETKKCTSAAPVGSSLKSADSPQKSSLPVLGGAIGSMALLVLVAFSAQKMGLFNIKFLGTFTRKFIAMTPVILVAYNTIVSLYGLASGATTRISGKLVPSNLYMGFYSYTSYVSYMSNVDFILLGSEKTKFPASTKFWSQTCAGGNAPSKLSISCSYENHDTFRVGLAVWSVFFILFLLYRCFMTWNYDSLDLRFLIATQRLNCLMINKFFLTILFLLSVITALLVFYFTIMFSFGGIYWGSIIQAAIFVAVNFLTAKTMSNTIYHFYEEVPCCCGLIKNWWRKLKPMSDFPTPCKISLPNDQAKWFNGVFISHNEIFHVIETALSKSAAGDNVLLLELGDPDLIKQYMGVLTKLDEKTKRKNAKKAKAVKSPNGLLARFSSLSPLFALLLGIVNLFQNGFDVAETYSPTEKFVSVPYLGFFSSSGGTTRVQSSEGYAVEVPANAIFTEWISTRCLPNMRTAKFSNNYDEIWDKHVGATLTCPPQLAFYMMALVSLVSIYLFSWIGYRLALTWQYKVGDLRFLIATDRANNLRYNYIFCCCGVFLSTMALLSLWYYRAQASASVSEYLLDIVSFALMIVSVLGYSKGRYETSTPNCGDQQSNFSVNMSEFPHECKFSLPPAEVKLSNLYGALVTHEKIFNIIELALIQSSRGEEDMYSLLCAGGDANTPRLLKQYMAVLLAKEKSQQVEMTEFVENPMPEATRRSLSENAMMSAARITQTAPGRDNANLNDNNNNNGNEMISEREAAEAERMRNEITRIYQVCNPGMLQGLPNLFSKYRGGEQTLLDTIRKKYASQLSGQALNVTTTASTSSVSGGTALAHPQQGYSQRFSIMPTNAPIAPVAPEAPRLSFRVPSGAFPPSQIAAVASITHPVPVASIAAIGPQGV